jgi:hypothetical protein
MAHQWLIAIKKVKVGDPSMQHLINARVGSSPSTMSYQVFGQELSFAKMQCARSIFDVRERPFNSHSSF